MATEQQDEEGKEKPRDVYDLPPPTAYISQEIGRNEKCKRSVNFIGWLLPRPAQEALSGKNIARQSGLSSSTFLMDPQTHLQPVVNDTSLETRAR